MRLTSREPFSCYVKQWIDDMSICALLVALRFFLSYCSACVFVRLCFFILLNACKAGSYLHGFFWHFGLHTSLLLVGETLGLGK